MKLITYNVLALGARTWMRPWQKKIIGNPERHDELVGLFKELDPCIVGLQEIWSPVIFEAVGRELGRFAVTAKSRYPARCGLLSRFPILRHRTHWFRRNIGAWGRSFLEAELDLGGDKRLTVFVVHLPLHSTAMIRSVCLFKALEKRYSDDVVVLGDFNCLPHFGVPNEMKKRGFVESLDYLGAAKSNHHDAALKPVRLLSSLPGQKRIQEGSNYIDYIFLSESWARRIREGRFIVNDTTKKLSDHYPYMVCLEAEKEKPKLANLLNRTGRRR